jgi:Domain of unknown function (DUF5916)/Carbohydrate family 9 binding domain-like
MKAFVLSLNLLAVAIPSVLYAQTQTPLSIPRLSGEMKADGKLDEPFWQQAASTTLAYEVSPGENLPAAVKTTVYIADSGTSLRIAYRAQDPNPEKIVAVLRDRDSAFQDDFVGIRLDTFNNQQRAYQFFVSARGVQMDLTYDESNGNEDESWDAFWDSGASINADGYIVEMEIPYSSLKFKHSTAPQQWGIQHLRIRPRESRFVYTDNQNDRNNKCDLCQQNKMLGFAHADPGRNIVVNPTFTAGFAETRNAPGQAFSNDGVNVDLGLDVSWSPTPNNTLSATFNPDFSQVEIDGAQLDVNTSFALFFQEKRPFFLESADYFSSPTNLVYTRNIADPDYGLRYTGRSGDHTYGFFGASDTITNILRPGPFGSSFGSIQDESTDAVGVYRYSLNETSNIGTLVTHRSSGEYSNTMASIDGKWQKGAHTLIGQWMHSDTDDAFGYQATPFTGDAFYARYGYRDREKSFNIQHSRRDPGFRADMGFVGRVDFEQSVIGGSYRWYPKNSFFTEISVNGDWDITHQVSVDRLIEREIEAYINLSGKYQSYMEGGGGKRVRYWNGVTYDESFYSAYGQFTPFKSWKFSLFYRGGDQIDFNNNDIGKIQTFEPGISGTLNDNISLSFNYIDEALKRDGGTVYHAKLLDTRLSWQFNLRQRLRLAVQYGTTDLDLSLEQGYQPGDPTFASYNSLGTQLVYSYKINPRTVFYAGYSDNYGGSNSQDSFQLGRSLFLKLGYAWQP